MTQIPTSSIDPETQELVTTNATHITVQFESDTEADRSMTVVVHTIGLDWDDIEFAGDVVPATLTPFTN